MLTEVIGSIENRGKVTVGDIMGCVAPLIHVAYDDVLHVMESSRQLHVFCALRLQDQKFLNMQQGNLKRCIVAQRRNYSCVT